MIAAPMPERIQLRRTKGWRIPPDTVKVDRTTKWGNPFDFRAADFCWVALSYGCRGDAAGRRQASIIAYRHWLMAHPGAVIAEYDRGVVMEIGDKKIEIGSRAKAGRAPTLDEIREALRGRDLACWCPLTLPDGSRCPCHADTLLEIANG